MCAVGVDLGFLAVRDDMEKFRIWLIVKPGDALYKGLIDGLRKFTKKLHRNVGVMMRRRIRVANLDVLT